MRLTKLLHKGFKMKATLVLSDGSTFVGESLGASGEKVGEVVFNTAMTGYQEILTEYFQGWGYRLRH